MTCAGDTVYRWFDPPARQLVLRRMCRKLSRESSADEDLCRGEDSQSLGAQNSAHKDGARGLLYVPSVPPVVESRVGVLLWLKCSLSQAGA